MRIPNPIKRILYSSRSWALFLAWLTYVLSQIANFYLGQESVTPEMMAKFITTATEWAMKLSAIWTGGTFIEDAAHKFGLIPPGGGVTLNTREPGRSGRDSG